MTSELDVHPSMGRTVREIVKHYATRIKDNHIFFQPQIPPRKLKNALETYAPGIQGEDVLVLVDNTVFGSAKEGGVLTQDTLYVRNQMERPQNIALADIESVQFIEGWTSYVHVNDTKFLQINCPEKAAMRRFTQMLQEIRDTAVHPALSAGPAAEALRELEYAEESQSYGRPTSARPAAEALRELKSLRDEGLITDEEYEEKRKEYLARL